MKHLGWALLGFVIGVVVGAVGMFLFILGGGN